MSNLATRIQVTEKAVEGFKQTDTSILQERMATVEGKTEFNNDSIKKLNTTIDATENKLSKYMEKELSKLYDIINDNPLGN